MRHFVGGIGEKPQNSTAHQWCSCRGKEMLLGLRYWCLLLAVRIS